MKIHVFRLKAAQDLKLEIEKFVQSKNIKAGLVLTCVGSLTKAKLRMPGATADSQDVKEFKGHFEIVSLVGTVSVNGSHLHMSISDKEGQVSGGHLKDGCRVGTTIEMVIGEEKGMAFSRDLDPKTGFEELTISNKSSFPGSGRS